MSISILLFVLLNLPGISLLPLYFRHIELDLAWFGVIYALVNVIGAAFGFFAKKLLHRCPAPGLLFLLAGLLAAGFVAMGLLENRWGIVFVLIQGAVLGLHGPLTRTLMNAQLADSRIRATMLSFESFGQRAVLSLAALALGPVIARAGIGRVFLLLGLCGGMVMLALARRFIHLKKQGYLLSDQRRDRHVNREEEIRCPG
jgi:MFS family permease